jgi:hypothetical protein
MRAGKKAGDKVESVCIVTCAVDADGSKAREQVKGQIAFSVTIPYYDILLDLPSLAEKKARIQEVRLTSYPPLPIIDHCGRAAFS